jgi:hypothetical protein
MDYSAPNSIKPWLECLFWFAAFCAALFYIARQLRGSPPQPPNETLALSGDELTRRVAHLENENKQVWEKMERDRIESKNDLSLIKADVAALKASTDLGNQRSCQMDAKIDCLLARK